MIKVTGISEDRAASFFEPEEGGSKFL